MREDWNDVARSFRESSWGVRTFAYFFGGLGLVFALLGVVNDLNETWQTLPFTVNLASSLTAACFGIPVALIVLRAISTRQDEPAAALRASRLAVAVANELRDKALRLAGGGRSPEEVHKATERAYNALNSLHVDLDRSAGTTGAVLGFYDRFLDAGREFDEAILLFEQFRPGHDQEGRLAEELFESWQTWITYVRPQLLGAGVSGVTQGKDTPLQRLEWKNPFSKPGLAEATLVRELEKFLQGYQSVVEINRKLVWARDEMASRRDCAQVVRRLIGGCVDLATAVGETRDPTLRPRKGLRRLFSDRSAARP